MSRGTLIPSEDDIRQALRKNVRALRLAAGLTLKQASARGDLHWRHWQKIEAAEVNTTLETLAKLCRALQCTVRDLFDDPSRHGPIETKR